MRAGSVAPECSAPPAGCLESWKRQAGLLSSTDGEAQQRETGPVQNRGFCATGGSGWGESPKTLPSQTAGCKFRPQMEARSGGERLRRHLLATCRGAGAREAPSGKAEVRLGYLGKHLTFSAGVPAPAPRG